MAAEGPGDAETAAERANRRICALFDACREAGTPRGVRDAALLSVLFGANLPRGRALGLERGDFDAATGRLRAPGGGASGRRAGEGALEALREWVRLRGEAPGPLFCRLERGRPDPSRRLEPPAVDALLERWAEAAGVRDASPRAFRELYRSPWWSDAPRGQGEQGDPG